MIQTRHRIPEHAAAPKTRFMVFQVPHPGAAVRFLEPSARQRRGACMALADYGLMHVKLYEDIARITAT